MAMKYFFTLLLLCSFLQLSAQSYTLKTSPEPASEESNSYSFSFLYKLKENTAKTRQGEFQIPFPKDFKAGDTAFATEYFLGHPGSVPRGIGLLVADYLTGQPRIYVDLNNNLNFSDDGSLVKLGEDSTAILTFHRNDNPQATFSIRYSLSYGSSEEGKEIAKMFHHQPLIEKGYMLPNHQRFDTKRMNNRMGSGDLDGIPIKFALHDYDCNGYFDDNGSDRLFISYPDVDFRTDLTSGAFTLQDDSTYFAFNDQNFEVTEVDSLGSYFSFKKADAEFKPPLANGQKLPDLGFELINGQKASFDQYLGDGKYFIIDVWGNWCKGCHQSAPDLKKLAEDHSDKVKVIGLNTGEPNETIKKFTNDYGHDWDQGRLTPEIREELKIDGYPRYILVAPDGRILEMKTYPYLIRKKLEEGS